MGNSAATGHLSLIQLKVMSAIEHCRTAALGGHVEACEDCGQWRIAYNSCRNRHCPKCQGAAARTWLAEREADLLPVGYFHVVFTLPAEVADIAFQNKALVFDLLFKAASETMLTIAADPRHLGARIGITAVLHTWGSAMTHHPNVHMIVPGGGFAPDGHRWISSRPAFLLPAACLARCSDGSSSRGCSRCTTPGGSASSGPWQTLPSDAPSYATLLPFGQSAGWSPGAVRRTGGGARLSVALHSPGGNL